MLYHGIAQPYLAIFDEEGIPVMNPLTGIPLGAYITSFYYKYDEEKENQASISFSTGNPDIVDAEALQKDKTVLFQWGYIFSNGDHISSPIKVVKVKDFNCKFDSSGTTASVIFIDSTVEQRYLPPHKPSAEDDDEDGYSSMVDFMERGCDHGLGIIIEKFEH
jgi:hypothetical protein